MTESPDESLYAQFRAGDAGAFALLYERYRQPLYLFLLRSVPSRSDAEDLFQELWMRVINTDTGFREGSVRAWLFQIARNLRIDLFRRRHFHVLVADADADTVAAAADLTPAAERQVHDADCRQRLLAQLNRLPQDQKDAFLLHQESGLPLATIGRITGVGRETVKSRLRYAMKRLREALEDCL